MKKGYCMLVFDFSKLVFDLDLVIFIVLWKLINVSRLDIKFFIFVLMVIFLFLILKRYI